jgi:hypothetical protein
MPHCDGLFVNGLQAANNLYFVICWSLVTATVLTSKADNHPMLHQDFLKLLL